MPDSTSSGFIHDEQYIQVLRGIIEGSRDFIAAVDTSLRFVAFNRAYRDEFRNAFDREVRVGNRLPDLLTHLPEQQERLVGLWQRAVDGESFTVEAEFGQGEAAKHYEIRFNPLTDWLGRHLGAFLIARDITDRLRAEARLREAERHYRSIYENVSEGIFKTSPDGTYLEANDMLARIYGYESVSDLMASVRDIRNQLYVDQGRREEFARLMGQHDLINDFESEITRKDGQRIWISENAHAVRDAAGEVLYYEGTVQNVTARKNYEIALRESEILYHSLVEGLPVNIFRKDQEERFTFANQRFCTTLGKSLDQIVGRTDFDFFPPNLAAKYQADDRRVMETRVAFEEIEAWEGPDGGKRYVHVLKMPLMDLQNRVIGIQGLFWDETDRKQAEVALAHERDLLRALLDNVPDRIYFKDRESRFLRASRALAQRLGLHDPEEVVGKTDFDFHPEEQAREFFDDEQKILQTGVAIISKVEHQVAPGRPEAWASVTKVPVRNQQGEVTGLIGLSRDITSLKKIEDELQEARDAALDLVRQKSQFLAMMSHEIRTPMNGILGMSELLLDAKLAPKLRDFAETIRSSTEALLTIINDILDFSKIEAGKLALNLVDFDLRDTVETVAELLASRAEAKGIELVTSIPAGTPTAVTADAGRLRQVLTNLVGNAVKFTDHGEVVVRVTQVSRLGGEARLRFAVTDTGIGVPKEVQERIFQAFTQADGSTTRRFGGTGLGLAISKQLLELMGGVIGVESVPGAGSTFWFELPLKLQQRDESHTGLRFPGYPALIADDNPAHAEALREMLDELGMNATTCLTAEATLSSLREAAQTGRPIRVVIADVQIHDNDGLALAAKIKQEPAIAGADIILMTDLDEDVHGASEENIAAKLPKPVRKKRLISCLATVLLGAKPRLESGAAEATTAATSPLNGLRVLLAEDNAVNRKVALRQLEKIGLTAETVTDGYQVLEALGKQAYDVILMDCQMPGLDGYQTTREIRQRESAAGQGSSRVYIVAMTANALVGDREECIGAGMDDYIVKPVEVSKLRAALSRGTEHVMTTALADGTRAMPGGAPAETIDFTVLSGFGDLSNPSEAPGVVELIDLFLEDAPSQIGKIATAIETGNRQDLRLFAHTLKGSATNMGARPLAEICLQLEQRASISDQTQERELLSRLHAEWDRTQNALEAAKRSAGGARP